jgi:beta-lactamase class A
MILTSAPAQSPVPETPDKAWQHIQYTLKLRRGQPRLDRLIPSVQHLTAGTDNTGRYAVYLEDLKTAQYTGIAMDRKYTAWSLLKLGVLVTVLEKMEQGALSPDMMMPLPAQDKSSPPAAWDVSPASSAAPVRELLERLITHSDNTASFVLSGTFHAAEFQQTLRALGLSCAGPDEPAHTLPDISARQMGHALRMIYHSALLSRPFSQLVLSLLSSSIYDSQLPRHLPPSVPVCHLAAFNADSGDFHDCGIIFAPGRPYILCVMSSGNNRKEADRVISDISRAVYRFFTRPLKNRDLQ